MSEETSKPKQRPTVGRVVHYNSGVRDRDGMTVLDASQPMRADVVFVHEDGSCNLVVTDHEGHWFVRLRVNEREPSDTAPGGSFGTWSWPPRAG